MNRDRNSCYCGSESFIGLSEFWDCLDKKQKRSLLTIHREAILEEIVCETCKELLLCAMEALDSATECKDENCPAAQHDRGSNLLMPTASNPSHHHHYSGPNGQSLGILLKSPSGYFASSLQPPQKAGSRSSSPLPQPYLPPAALAAVSASGSTSGSGKDKAGERKGKEEGAGADGHGGFAPGGIVERAGYELFSYLQPGGAFEIDPKGNFSRTVCGMSSSSSLAMQTQPHLQNKENGSSKNSSNGDKGAQGGQLASASLTDPPTPPPPYLPPPCYCRDKYHVRFVDMLTYPRPIRKFQMLLDKGMRLALVREMMAAEVGLDAAGSNRVGNLARLVLMAKGKALPPEKDHLSLEQLGFRDNMQVIISKVLGEPPEENRDADEKNKQFVGDLLFGHANNDAPTQPGSIVESYKISHGYQVLGRSLELAGQNRVWRGYLAELNARANERALLASLLEEEKQGGGESGAGSKDGAGQGQGKSKNKARKQKKKEKEKKKKEELARKKKEDEEEKLRQRKERERIMKEKVEAEKKAKEEARRKELEVEEKLWWEAQIKKHSPSTPPEKNSEPKPSNSITYSNSDNSSKPKTKRRQNRKSTKQPHSSSSSKNKPSGASESAVNPSAKKVGMGEGASNMARSGRVGSLGSVGEKPVSPATKAIGPEFRGGSAGDVAVRLPNFCGQCGTRFLVKANFCSNCGAPVLPVSNPAPGAVGPASTSPPMVPTNTDGTRSLDILPIFAALHAHDQAPNHSSTPTSAPAAPSNIDQLVPEIESLGWKGGRLPLFERLRASSSSPTLGPATPTHLPPPPTSDGFNPEQNIRNDAGTDIGALPVEAHQQMAQFGPGKNLTPDMITYLANSKSDS